MKTIALYLTFLLCCQTIAAMYMVDGQQGRFVWLPSNKKFMEEMQNLMTKEEKGQEEEQALERLFDANLNERFLP